MIKVEINHDGGKTQVLVSGHAGYDAKGKDIVCAGVSTIAQAYAVECMEKSECDSLYIADGCMEVITNDDDGNEIRLEMLKRGLELIQKDYSEYLSIEESKKII